MIQTRNLYVCLRPPFQKTLQDLYVCKWALISIMVYTGSWCCCMFTLPLLYLSQSFFVLYVLLLARFQPLLSSLNWNRWSINYGLKYSEDQLWSTRLQSCRSPHPRLSVHPSSASLFIPLLFEDCRSLFPHWARLREWKGGFVFAAHFLYPDTLPLRKDRIPENLVNLSISLSFTAVFLTGFEWKAQGGFTKHLWLLRMSQSIGVENEEARSSSNTVSFIVSNKGKHGAWE